MRPGTGRGVHLDRRADAGDGVVRRHPRRDAAPEWRGGVIVYYVHTDHLNTPRLVTDTSDNICAGGGTPIRSGRVAE